MGILDLVEEAAGAFAAVKAVEAIDPNAGLLEKGAAAFAGFKGAEVLKEKVAEHLQSAEESEGQAGSASSAT